MVTRLPNLLGLSPSALFRIPAFIISSLKRMVASMSCCFGITPASLFAVAFKMTMTRMSFSLYGYRSVVRLADWPIGANKDRQLRDDSNTETGEIGNDLQCVTRYSS